MDGPKDNLMGESTHQLVSGGGRGTGELSLSVVEEEEIERK